MQCLKSILMCSHLVWIRCQCCPYSSGHIDWKACKARQKTLDLLLAVKEGQILKPPLEWCFWDVVIGLFQYANYSNLSNMPSRKTQRTRLHMLSRKDDKLQLFLFQHYLGSVNACACTYQSLADHLYQALSHDWPKWLEQWYILSQICGQRRSFEGLFQKAKFRDCLFIPLYSENLPAWQTWTCSMYELVLPCWVHWP